MKILKQAAMLSFCASVVLSGCAFKNDKNNIKKINLEQAQGKFENGYFKYYDYETLTSYNPREDDYESLPNFITHFPFEINGNILKKGNREDHDYFLFSIAKRKEINIDFQASGDDVYFRLYKYGTNRLDNSIAFGLGSGSNDFGSYDLILDPGSYYIEFSNYNSFNNSISYSLKCNSILEYNSFDYSNISENFNTYGCVYWQNDKSPFNNCSFDDIFKTVHSFPNEHIPLYIESEGKLCGLDENHFLDSVWYIWDKEFMKTLVPYLDCMIKVLQEEMINEVAGRYDGDMGSLVVSTVENFLSYLPLPNWINYVLSAFDSLNLLYNFCTWSNDKNDEINKMKTFTNTLIYLSRLREKCYELSLNVNDHRVIKITRYSTIIYNKYGFYCTRNFDCAFAKEGNAFDLISDAEIFKSNVYDYQNNKTYQGTFKLFRRTVSNDYGVFFDKEGIILDSRWNEFESTCECLDQNRHIVTYINGYKSIENHEMIYSESEGYHCEKCGHTESIPTSSISKNDFAGFGGQYCDQVKSVNFTTADGYNVQAYGLRCGLIDDRNGNKYFALSGKSRNVTNAYIILYFDEAIPVYSISFDFSLWSENEGVKTKGKNFAECFVKENAEYHEFDDVMAFDIANLHTKDNPDNFTVTYGNRRIRALEIHIVCNHSMTSTDAKGRFVLDNIELNKGIY